MSPAVKARYIPQHKQTGFSLIELMIVIAIIGTFISVALLNITSVRRNYGVINDTGKLSALVTLARMRAVSTFSRVQVLCNNVTNQCSLQTKPYGSSTWSADSNKQTLTLTQGVSFGVPPGVSAGVGGQSSTTPYQGSSAQSISYAVILNSRGLPIVDNATGTSVSDYALYLLGPNNISMAVATDGTGTSSVYALNGSQWQVFTQ